MREDYSNAAKRKLGSAAKTGGKNIKRGGMKFNPLAKLDNSQVKDRRNPRYRSK